MMVNVKCQKMQKENVHLHQLPLLRVAGHESGIVGHYQDPIHSKFNNKCLVDVDERELTTESQVASTRQVVVAALTIDVRRQMSFWVGRSRSRGCP